MTILGKNLLMDGWKSSTSYAFLGSFQSNILYQKDWLSSIVHGNLGMVVNMMIREYLRFPKSETMGRLLKEMYQMLGKILKVEGGRDMADIAHHPLQWLIVCVSLTRQWDAHIFG